MKVKIRTFNTSEIWYIIYIFIAIFQPPFLPVSFIYIWGLLTILLLAASYGGLKTDILNKSGLTSLSKLFLFMFMYLVIVGSIDIAITSSILLNNRARCINQLIVLSFIQFAEVWYIIRLTRNLNLSLREVLNKIILAGAIQGICSVVAYMIPSVRMLFLQNMEKRLTSNTWFMERRGYGFSGTLIDTFGYGMGLIGGYLILSDWSKNKIKKILCLFLISFSVFVNARTGIVILCIAVFIRVFQKAKGSKFLIRIFVVVPSLIILFCVGIPVFLNTGLSSDNPTINWIAKGFNELYRLIRHGKNSGLTLNTVSFLSRLDIIPENAFELMFGSGHTIYDTLMNLGYRTDAGLINALWEFGIVGSIVVIGGVVVWLVKPFRKSESTHIRTILVLNAVSYVILLLKAIQITYSPGLFVTYLSTATIYYFVNTQRNRLSSDG